MLIPTGKELIDPQVVLKAADLREGQTVADLGCGSLGHYVFPAAATVGKEGKVYAVDILKSALSAITGRIKLEGISQVEPLWGNIERLGGIPVKDETLDHALIVNNLFLAKDKILLGQEAFRLLKSFGRLTVVDWKVGGAPFGPSPAQRVNEDQARMTMQTAGFRFMKSFSPGPYHYGLVFEKS
ncbi:methyltransferase domain-containing protein [Candidatus Uhrbacteria bacterium]|nr:methyltransferase domain-containing protein [Candidatus Uhrbacteria bacterium]